MNQRILTTTTAMLFAAAVPVSVFAADTGAKASSNSGTQTQQQPNHQRQESAPEGFVLLEENTVYMMAREPQQHLLRAHEQIEARNPKAAAAELRLAAAYLKMQEARPGAKAKGMLTHWQQQLDDLAGRVEKGDANSQELTRTAAGANYALAKYFDQRARGEIGQAGKEVAAGYDLQAAADCFEQSLIWSGPSTGAQRGQTAQTAQKSNLQQQEIKAIGDARLAADRLISAQNLAAEQHSGAQPAAARSGPANPSAAGSSAQAADPTQACEELSKVIGSRSDTFKQQNAADEHQKASATPK